MSKRIPLQSSVTGFSEKSWNRFVHSLDESELLYFNQFRDNDEFSGIPSPSICKSIQLKAKVSGYRRFSPAPRLVGIETNPGPKRSHRKSRVVELTARGPKFVRAQVPSTSSTSSYAPSSSSTMIPLARSSHIVVKKRKNKSRGSKLGRGPTSIQQYRNSLANPFDNYPPSVQAGSLLPLQKRTLFTRTSVDVVGTNYPWALITSKPGSTNSLRVYGLATAGTLVSAGVLLADMTAMNATSFNANTQSARCIAGGLAVEIKAGSGVIPPTVYAGSIFDALSNIQNSSANTYLTIPAIRVIDCSTDNLGAFSTWRPYDSTAFELNAKYSLNWGLDVYEYTQCVLIKVGTGSTITVNPRCVYHMETNAGMDAGGSLDDDGVVLAGSLMGSVEDVARVGVNLPEPVSGTLDVIIHSLMDEFTAAASRGPSGLSLRSEGGLVGSLSSHSTIRGPPSSPLNSAYEAERGVGEWTQIDSRFPRQPPLLTRSN